MADKIILKLRENPEITQNNLADEIGVPLRTIQRSSRMKLEVFDLDAGTVPKQANQLWRELANLKMPGVRQLTF